MNLLVSQSLFVILNFWIIDLKIPMDDKAIGS